MQINDCVAVLTGAGSGIGRALALALAQKNCHLALADLNTDALAETAAQARALGVRVSEHRLNVADREAVAALPEAVMAEHGKVDLLINNAGVALGGNFDQVSTENFDWLMSINFDAVVCMCRAFLPLLKQRPAARVINISSLFGLITPAGQTAYCASKFAVRGFSNALRLELKDTSVGVTVVHPGGVATAIASSARSPEGVCCGCHQARLRTSSCAVSSGTKRGFWSVTTRALFPGWNGYYRSITGACCRALQPATTKVAQG